MHLGGSEDQMSLLVIYPSIVTEKERCQQGIPRVAVGKDSLKDEAGILTKDLMLLPLGGMQVNSPLQS